MLAKFIQPYSPILICLLFAAIILYRSPFSASNLSVVPDSVESAVTAQRFYTLGKLDIAIERNSYPSRYPPYFSSLGILPSHLVLGPDLGSGIIFVFATALGAVVCAYFIGQCLGGALGASLAVLALIATPGFFANSREILNHVPVVFSTLLSALFYLRKTHSFFAGLAITIAAAFRPISFLLVLPFLVRDWRNNPNERVKTTLILGGMLSILLVGTLVYNSNIFGAPFHSGYHYWTPEIYNSLDKVINISFLVSNLSLLLIKSGLLAIIALTIVGLLSKRSLNIQSTQLNNFKVNELLIFIIYATAPQVIFHLFYFFPWASYYLPFTCLCSILAAQLTIPLLEHAKITTRKILISMALLTAIIAFYRSIYTYDPIPMRRLIAERLSILCAKDAIIISGIDPVYLTSFINLENARNILAVSRRVEYASRVTAEGKAVIEKTAVDNMEFLEQQVKAGRSLCIDTGTVSAAELTLLSSRFLIEQTPERVSQVREIK